MTGRAFWFDGNGKITLDNGSFAAPRANAFSLLHIDDCPGATAICKASCYVHGLKARDPQAYECYRQNSVAIREALDEGPDHLEGLARGFANWINTNCPTGFRWHVSGDIFSEVYARFIATVSKRLHGLCWIYTRSFDFVPLLGGSPQFVVNLSADADNYEAARRLHAQAGHRICYMTVDGVVPDDLPAGSVIFPSYELRGRDLPDPKQAPWWLSITHEQQKMVCPPDFFGQSESLRCGPCDKCLH